VVGRNVAKWDPRWMATGAFTMFAVVLWMRANFTADTPFGAILLPTLLQGGAMAFFFIPLTTLTLAGQPPEKIPAAAGLSNFVRITAGAMGTSIATTLWDRRATLHHEHLTEQLGQGSAAYSGAQAALGGAGVPPDAVMGQISRLIDVQAYTRAADDIFLGSAVMFLVLIATVWLTRRPPKLAPQGGGPAGGGAH
jgi:DHA2 family multidrug resistance protein